LEQAQINALRTLRKNRDNQQADRLLEQLRSAAEDTENLMPLLIACVEVDLTLGEICGTLREVWGEYRPVVF